MTDAGRRGGRSRRRPTSQYPNRVRVETKLPEAAIVQVYDGTQGLGEGSRRRARRAGADGPRAPGQPPSATRSRCCSRPATARCARGCCPMSRSGGDGKAYRALELSGATLDPIVLYVDPETHLIAKQTLRRRRRRPAARRRAVLRLPAGRRRPDRVHARRSAAAARPMSRAARHVDFAINDPLDPALFKRPALERRASCCRAASRPAICMPAR